MAILDCWLLVSEVCTTLSLFNVSAYHEILRRKVAQTFLCIEYFISQYLYIFIYKITLLTCL